MPASVTEALRQEDPSCQHSSGEVPALVSAGTRPERKIQPDILLPLLADQWLKLIDQVVLTRGSAIAPFQIDSAGVTRHFETIIRELNSSGERPGSAEMRSPLLLLRNEPTEVQKPQMSAQLMKRMDAALQKLTADTKRHGKDLAVAVREITQVAAESLNAARAGVWVTNDDGSTLTCADLYLKAENAHTTGLELNARNYPAYFAALQSERVIAAPIARKDPRTYELGDCYLVPNRISSRLDAPIRHHGRLTGFITVEHIGPCRPWTSEEISFIGSLADLMALIAESNKRQNAEVALKYSHSLLTAAFNSMADGIVIVSREGIITGSNQKFLDLWKIEGKELINRTAREVLHLFSDQVAEPEHFTLTTQSLFAHPELESVDVVECKDGRVFERTSKPQWLENEIVGRVCSYRDLTAQRHSEKANKGLEVMLLQAQKLEALGTLAGGIAHDFNNILTAILGHAELALSQSSEPRVQQSLDEIFKASDRAKHLVKQILTFCRKQTAERKTQLVRPVLTEVMNLLRATTPSNIEIQAEFDPVPTSACYDPAQLHQVVMNLCTNAAHAMRASGGTIRIGESLMEVTEASAAKYPELAVGPYAHLWVSDTGTGMEPETARRIFEPFFTTKGEGEGTGLGLSVVHGIIKDHQGAITVESKLGSGTTFHVYLPVSFEKEEMEELPNRRGTPLSRGERILFIDDDQAVGHFIRQALEMAKYSVDVFDHPIDALEHFSQKSYDYDLVITDLGLPRINGIELATRIQKIAPGIPVILLSGSQDGVPFPTLAKAGIRRVITKPVSCRDLSLVVRDVLDMNRSHSEDE